MEAFCQLAQAIHFNMSDGKVHLVIDKVIAEDDGTDIYLVAGSCKQKKKCKPLGRSAVASQRCK